MISIKRFLDGAPVVESGPQEVRDGGVLPAVVGAYRGSLEAMGESSYEACPGVGDGLKRRLAGLAAGLSAAMSGEETEAAREAVEQELREWGRSTARHLHEQAGEVKELLLTMAGTAEAVGTRDKRCAGQMHEVTERLARIATLDDLSHIRTAIAKSANELKGSIERMEAEGRAAVEDLRRQVKTYQAKLDEAEELASRDALTGVRNRLSLESMIEGRIKAGQQFAVAMVDLDGFKGVNDTYGHQAGDELLVQFASELRSACRSADAVGRWGGDEFVLVIESSLADATARIERLRPWICGDYTLKTGSGVVKLHVNASIGLAGFEPGETMKALMARADKAMYECKAAARGSRNTASREVRLLQRAS